jgi:hypothetical protein
MYYGFNGTNWFRVQTLSDISLMIDAAPKKGFVLRFRADKPYLPLDEEVQKVIDLHNYFGTSSKEFNVIFTADIDVDAQVMFDAIDTLIVAGVNVVCVEAGNEYYSKEQANFDFEYYRQKFDPLRNLLLDHHHTIPFSIFLAPRSSDSNILGGRNDHKGFNDAALEYMSTAPSKDGVSIHIYYGGNEAPIIMEALDKQDIREQEYNEEADVYYQQMYEQSQASDLFEATINYLDDKFEGRDVWITEFGFNSAGTLKNTLAYATAMFAIWAQWKGYPSIKALCEHNGISPTNTGCITPVDTDLDEYEGVNAPRTSYFAFQCASNMFDNSYAYPYITLGDTNEVSVSVPDDKAIVSAIAKSVSGQYYYSSSGKAPFMSRRSDRSFEIDGVKELPVSINGNTVSGTFPDNSFGVIVVDTVDIVEPPKPRWCRLCKYKLFQILGLCEDC